MLYVTQVAVGKRPYLNVHGNGYATPASMCANAWRWQSGNPDGDVPIN